MQAPPASNAGEPQPSSPLDVYSDARDAAAPVWLPLPPNAAAVAIDSYCYPLSSSDAESTSSRLSHQNLADNNSVATLPVIAASRLTLGDVVLLIEAYAPCSKSPGVSDSEVFEPTWYRGCVFAGTCANQKRDAPPALGVFPASHLLLCGALPTREEMTVRMVPEQPLVSADISRKRTESATLSNASNARIVNSSTSGSRGALLSSADALQYSVPNLDTSFAERQHGASAAVSLNKLLPDLLYPSPASASYNEALYGARHTRLLEFSAAAMRDWAFVMENAFRESPQNLALCAKARRKIIQLSSVHCVYAALARSHQSQCASQCQSQTTIDAPMPTVESSSKNVAAQDKIEDSKDSCTDVSA